MKRSLLDSALEARSREQIEDVEMARRVYCGDGCGVWWYRVKRNTAGRHRKYLNAQHAARARKLGLTSKNRRRSKSI